MRIVFNFLSGHLDFIDTDGPVPDPLTVNNLIVNQLLTAQHIHGELAGPVYIHVKNTANVTISKGTPVYVTGAVGETSTLEIGAADASDPLKMPAIGLLGSQLAHNAFGHAIVAGELLNLSTDAYAIGTSLFVAPGGGLTSSRPVSSTIQQVAIVGRSQQNTGSVTVTINSMETLVAASQPGLQQALSGAAISYASTVDLNIASLNGSYRTVALTGDITFTTSSRVLCGRVAIRLLSDASSRNLSFPAGWKFVTPKPSSIAANKTAILNLVFYGTADTDCVAEYMVES